MKRLFCAVHIDATDAVLEVLAQCKDRLQGERIRWVDPSNMHLTLKFFGDTPPRQEQDIIQALKGALHHPADTSHGGAGESNVRVGHPGDQSPGGQGATGVDKRADLRMDNQSTPRADGQGATGTDRRAERESGPAKDQRTNNQLDLRAEREDTPGRDLRAEREGGPTKDQRADKRLDLRAERHVALQTGKLGPDGLGSKGTSPVHGQQTKIPVVKPFHLQIKGAGTFGPRSMPRVIWLGIEDGGMLNLLYHRINRALETLDMKADKPGFIPHLTLGRIKHLSCRNTLRELIDELSGADFGSAYVDSCVLYQSILRPQGPIYHPLEVFRL